MPNTLLDIAKSSGSDGLAGLVEECAPAVPEIGLIPVKPIKGIDYRANIRVGLPQGSFRSANEGSTPVGSVYEQQLFACHIANPNWLCDKAVADAHEDGAAAYIAAEAFGVALGEFVHIGKQVYYGTGNDAKGFPGLNVLWDSAAHTVDATGSAANTGSSVWFVKFGPEGVQFLGGNNQQLTMSDVITIVATDGNGKKYSAYYQEMLAWIGMKMANKHAAVRICNLTEQDNKTLNDKLLGKALAKFPVGLRPDACLMSRRSLEQLRSSRTATNATGAEAPTPTTFEGVPIIPTDSIVDTEAIV